MPGAQRGRRGRRDHPVPRDRLHESGKCADASSPRVPEISRRPARSRLRPASHDPRWTDLVSTAGGPSRPCRACWHTLPAKPPRKVLWRAAGSPEPCDFSRRKVRARNAKPCGHRPRSAREPRERSAPLVNRGGANLGAVSRVGINFPRAGQALAVHGKSGPRKIFIPVFAALPDLAIVIRPS